MTLKETLYIETNRTDVFKMKQAKINFQNETVHKLCSKIITIDLQTTVITILN